MKTIFATLALLAATTGLATATEYFSITTNFEDNTRPTTDFGGLEHVVTGETEISWLLTSFTEEEALKTGAWGQNSKNLISPHNVGKGREWQLTFENTVDVKEAFQLTAISFTYIVSDLEGGFIAGSDTRQVQWNISIVSLVDGSTLLETQTSDTATLNTGWRTTKNVEFNLEEEDFVTITDDYVVTIWAENPVLSAIDPAEDLLGYVAAVEAQPDAAYGLQTISFAAETLGIPVAPSSPAVPEPATATLSLLALAGLAARRRRR